MTIDNIEVIPSISGTWDVRNGNRGPGVIFEHMYSVRLFGWLMGAAALMAQAPSPAPSDAVKPASPREPGQYATFHTSKGTIVAKLFPAESPVTVKNFMDLALGRKPWKHPGTGRVTRRPLYNNTIFHRVIPEFMIQGGDPLGTGFGGTEPIRDEFHPTLKFDVPGRLAMANSGPNTGSSQFFITEVPTPHLNGLHTIFGQVVEGQELIGQIARVDRDGNNKPRTPVVLQRITFETIGADGKPVVPAMKAVPARKPATPVTKKSTTPAKPAAKKVAPPAAKKP
jgi:peptidyl-prolyl cis-trans isomerase A (cyclophilin A)